MALAACSDMRLPLSEAVDFHGHREKKRDSLYISIAGQK